MILKFCVLLWLQIRATPGQCDRSRDRGTTPLINVLLIFTCLYLRHRLALGLISHVTVAIGAFVAFVKALRSVLSFLSTASSFRVPSEKDLQLEIVNAFCEMVSV